MADKDQTGGTTGEDPFGQNETIEHQQINPLESHFNPTEISLPKAVRGGKEPEELDDPDERFPEDLEDKDRRPVIPGILIFGGIIGVLLLIAGFFAFQGGPGQQVECLAGSEEDQNGNCVECPLGSFSVAGGDCMQCPEDTIAAFTGQAACQPCGDGFSPNADQTECVIDLTDIDCSAGWEKDENGNCVACEPGSFSAAGNNCMQCPEDSVSAFEGAAECTLCGEGFSPNADQTECLYDPSELECTAGWEKDENGNCVACEPGSFSPAGQGCMECPEGTYVESEGAADCNTCPPGQTPNADQTGCIEVVTCPAGTTYNPFNGQCESTCGDGTCNPASENSDLCPQDCQCVDNGVCEAGEGANCKDCGEPGGACGVPCPTGQCSGGLSCLNGVCWDAAICGGGDPADSGGGGDETCACTPVCVQWSTSAFGICLRWANVDCNGNSC